MVTHRSILLLLLVIVLIGTHCHITCDLHAMSKRQSCAPAAASFTGININSAGGCVALSTWAKKYPGAASVQRSVDTRTRYQPLKEIKVQQAFRMHSVRMGRGVGASATPVAGAHKGSVHRAHKGSDPTAAPAPAPSSSLLASAPTTRPYHLHAGLGRHAPPARSVGGLVRCRATAVMQPQTLTFQSWPQALVFETVPDTPSILHTVHEGVLDVLPAELAAVAVAPGSSDGSSGPLVLAAFEGGIRVWDLYSHKLTATMPLPLPFALTVSPCGAFAAAAVLAGQGWDVEGATVHVWSLRGAADRATSSSSGSSGGFGSGSGGSRGVPKLHAVYHVDNHQDMVLSLAFAPGATDLLVGMVSGCVTVLDLTDLPPTDESSEEGEDGSSGNPAPQVSMLGSHTMCMEGYEDEDVGEDPIQSLAIPPGGTCAVAGTWSGRLHVFDAGLGACVQSLRPPVMAASVLTGQEQNWLGHHPLAVSAIAPLPDGECVLAAYGGGGGKPSTLCAWDVLSAECLGELVGVHDGRVTSLLVTPDGWHAVTSGDDALIKVWDLAQGACVACLEGHTSAVTSLALSPDGRTLVSGGDDRTLRVWDLSAYTDYY